MHVSEDTRTAQSNQIPITHTSTVSSRAAASRSTAAIGCPAGRASSCRCACSRACSAACSWRSSQRPTTPAVRTSSAISATSQVSGTAPEAAVKRRGGHFWTTIRRLSRRSVSSSCRPPRSGFSWSSSFYTTNAGRAYASLKVAARTQRKPAPRRLARSPWGLASPP